MADWKPRRGHIFEGLRDLREDSAPAALGRCGAENILQGAEHVATTSPRSNNGLTARPRTLRARI
jgi:hypothetical protein